MNQFPKTSWDNRRKAILAGEKTYISGTACKSCGLMKKYVINQSCVDCTLKKSIHKLSDIELMKPYRTKEKSNKKLVEWRKNNPNKVKDQRSRVKIYQAAYQSGRRVTVRNQTPENANSKMILEIYKEAKNITDKTGIPHEVDHKIAISKGGLHHQDNLQILSRRENRIKGNR